MPGQPIIPADQGTHIEAMQDSGCAAMSPIDYFMSIFVGISIGLASVSYAFNLY